MQVFKSRRLIMIILALIALGFIGVRMFCFAPYPIKCKVNTVRNLSTMKHALTSYHENYGVYPTQCISVAEIFNVLSGYNEKGENPEEMSFFSPMQHSSIDVDIILKDGWQRPFILINHNDGTNLTIRSVGKNGIDEGGEGDDCEINTKKFDILLQ